MERERERDRHVRRRRSGGGLVVVARTRTRRLKMSVVPVARAGPDTGAAEVPSWEVPLPYSVQAFPSTVSFFF